MADAVDLVVVALETYRVQVQRLDATAHPLREVAGGHIHVMTLQEDLDRPRREPWKRCVRLAQQRRDVNPRAGAAGYQSLGFEVAAGSQHHPRVSLEFAAELPRPRQAVAGREWPQVETAEDPAAELLRYVGLRRRSAGCWDDSEPSGWRIVEEALQAA